MTDGIFANKIQVEGDKEINSNSENQEFNPLNTGNKEDLEENKANIVENNSVWRFVSVEFFKEYFEITTSEVIGRLIKS